MTYRIAPDHILSEHVKVSLLVTGEGKMEFVDYEAVPAHFCEALILSKALGIGEKTAANLLDTYESVENLYAHTDELPQKSIREKLEENKEILTDIGIFIQFIQMQQLIIQTKKLASMQTAFLR